MSLVVLAFDIPALLFSPVAYGPIPLTDCDPACPANGFMIADRPTIADGSVSADIWRTTCSRPFPHSRYLIYRLATATRPRRRALLPVYVPALISLVPVVAYYAAVVDLVHVDREHALGRGLADQHRLRGASIRFSAFGRGEHGLRGDGVERDRLPPGREPKRLSAAHDAGRALDDPSLELGFRSRAGRRLFDSSGEPLPSTPPVGQSSTPVTRNGETVAVIVHDAALDTTQSSSLPRVRRCCWPSRTVA